MKPIHILLVEDNKGDIVLIHEALEEGKIHNSVAVVRDGAQAITYLEKRKPYENEIEPDLVLLDINLPKKNGHEVLKYIKEKPELMHIPVIMLTTSSSETDIMKSYKNHANCYITKPIDLQKFMEVVASIENFWISLVQLPNEKRDHT